MAPKKAKVTDETAKEPPKTNKDTRKSAGKAEKSSKKAPPSTGKTRSRSPVKQDPPLASSMRSPGSPSKHEKVSFAVPGSVSKSKAAKAASRVDRFPSLPMAVRSDTLLTTPVTQKIPRRYWTQNPDQVQPPWITCSSFVPIPVVELLMRHKKETALGIKYAKGDKITNMEGALHTFVTPIVLAWWHGEYRYGNPEGHRVDLFPKHKGRQPARQVLISDMIHQDFEFDSVMMKVATLRPTETTPPEEFLVPAGAQKMVACTRAEYDESLRRWIVCSLTKEEGLPSIPEVCKFTPLSLGEVLDLLIDLLTDDRDIPETVVGVYFWLKDPEDRATGLPLMSLEILVQTAIHQVRNEHDALKKICREQGYVYTYDPPVIFAKSIGNDYLLPLIHAVALRHHTRHSKLKKMHVFAYNDFLTGDKLQYFGVALQIRSHITVTTKAKLFGGDANVYSPPKKAEGAMLVLHNNSDGFGQNIEFEKGSGSLDAAIGQYSSAAASLIRTREDLLTRLAVHAD